MRGSSEKVGTVLRTVREHRGVASLPYGLTELFDRGIIHNFLESGLLILA